MVALPGRRTPSLDEFCCPARTSRRILFPMPIRAPRSLGRGVPPALATLVALLATGVGLAKPGAAAKPAAVDPRPAILGTWRGTSMCVRVPGNESCHDEQVVYDVEPWGSALDSVRLEADKIVDGKRQRMGDLTFGYEPRTGAWACEFRSPRYHGVWSFTPHGNRMSGILFSLPDSVVARHAEVARDTSGGVR